ncbi:MAG: ATP-binding protein [Candidatus Thorarchaeota archaeon]|nr:ATP-binding protein [Candidatus Thorarchaeota archaeon]
MGEERIYAEAVTLIEPEKQPTNRLSQYSVVTKAIEYHSLINRFDKVKRNLTDTGMQFGGRVLLIGPTGTDFEAFTHHLCREVPLKLVRFRMERMLYEVKSGADILRVGFEFARRNSPTAMYIEKVETVAPAKSDRSEVLQDELKRTGWDREEVLVVAATTRPQDIDAELLSAFDRIYVIEGTSLEDRIRILEQALKGREDIDPTAVAELTDGWGFSSLKHLAVSLFMTERNETGQIPRDKIEELIANSGVIPLNNPRYLQSVVKSTGGTSRLEIDSLDAEYPDDFLDQLYLMAVGEDYSATQRVVEVLNDGMPLSKEDREILARYPFLLSGTAEDKLTRLLRAKKSSDRLQRIMGR